jgi:hypothetical protein
MPESMLKRVRDGDRSRRLNRIGKDGRIIAEHTLENEVSGLIPVIARLCTASSGYLSSIYVCDSIVHHVHKGTTPGHFCGYRNIQMLVSYIRGMKAKGHERFEAGLPGILQIQDMIEEAWDRDPHSVGRQETGGIRNTRKWIGTPEVCTLPRLKGVMLMFCSRYYTSASLWISLTLSAPSLAKTKRKRMSSCSIGSNDTPSGYRAPAVQSAQVLSSSNLLPTARPFHDDRRFRALRRRHAQSPGLRPIIWPGEAACRPSHWLKVHRDNYKHGQPSPQTLQAE